MQSRAHIKHGKNAPTYYVNQQPEAVHETQHTHELLHTYIIYSFWQQIKSSPASLPPLPPVAATQDKTPTTNEPCRTYSSSSSGNSSKPKRGGGSDAWIECVRCAKRHILPAGVEVKRLPDDWCCTMVNWRDGVVDRSMPADQVIIPHTHLARGMEHSITPSRQVIILQHQLSGSSFFDLHTNRQHVRLKAQHALNTPIPLIPPPLRLSALALVLVLLSLLVATP